MFFQKMEKKSSPPPPSPQLLKLTPNHQPTPPHLHRSPQHIGPPSSSPNRSPGGPPNRSASSPPQPNSQEAGTRLQWLVQCFVSTQVDLKKNPVGIDCSELGRLLYPTPKVTVLACTRRTPPTAMPTRPSSSASESISPCRLTTTS